LEIEPLISVRVQQFPWFFWAALRAIVGGCGASPDYFACELRDKAITITTTQANIGTVGKYNLEVIMAKLPNFDDRIQIDDD
jgi:hypothetical protein